MIAMSGMMTLDPLLYWGMLCLLLLEGRTWLASRRQLQLGAQVWPGFQRRRYVALGLGLGGLWRLLFLLSLAPWLLVAGEAQTLAVRPWLAWLAGGYLLLRGVNGLLRLDGSVGQAEPASLDFRRGLWQAALCSLLFAAQSAALAIGLLRSPWPILLIWALVPLLLWRLPTDPWRWLEDHRLLRLAQALLLLVGVTLLAEGLGTPLPLFILYWLLTLVMLAAWLLWRFRYADDSAGLPSAEASADETPLPPLEQEAQSMLARVSQLSDLPIRAIMSVRHDVEMLDLSEPLAAVHAQLARTPHSRLVVIREGNKDAPLGILRKRDVLARLLQGEPLALEALVNPHPLCLPETLSVLGALDQFRQARTHMAFVLDEFGNFEGLITIRDVLEEIAGKLPEPGEEDQDLVCLGPGSYRVSGDYLLQELQRQIGFPAPPTSHYHTLAGWLLERLQRLPRQGEELLLDGWQINVLQLNAHRIETLWLRRQDS
ncbi:hemolysin family protein [Pseudaeromonas sp. ZJS20]|uniref:transporter associated domain-containing protein n=1 Tax=Pseudaeromonas aegiceratis TaxID=3153928 RepID=UPI00390C57E6